MNEGVGRLIFLHIPKTAGVTFRALLESQYPDRNGFFAAGAEHRQLFEMEPAERERIDLLAGHFRFGVHGLFASRSTYITFLRDPVERTISHYYFICQNPTHPSYEAVVGRGVSLEQWVREVASPPIEVNNTQTRYLAGDDLDGDPAAITPELLGRAKANLEHGVAFLGITERYEESVQQFASVLGWDLPARSPRLNATENRPLRDAIPPEALAAIREYTQLDAKLYAFACELFERRLRGGQDGPAPSAAGLLRRLWTGATVRRRET